MPSTAAPPATEDVISYLNPTSIAQLTHRLSRREETAFEEFHALYFDRLYRFLLVIARGQEHEAREALQETLLRVSCHARECPTEEVFWSWLKTVARNAARDGGRKHLRYLALLQKFGRGRHDAAPCGTDEEECWQRILNETLSEMAAADRQLVEAKYLDRQSVKELSAQTGLTDRAVESRLLRLRRQLREQMLKKLRNL